MLAAIRRHLAHQDGMSLVEVLVAISVLTIALLAMAGVAIASLGSLRHSKQRQQATAAVARSIELTRSLDYSLLALRNSDAPPAQYDPDEAGSLAAETVVTAAAGPVTGTPYQYTAGGVTVQTFVTWYDDAGPPAKTRAAKRVTVVATWGQGARSGDVRQSTLVAEADRGLPEPAFSVTPLAQSAYKAPGLPICLAHSLKNLGATDRYDVVLPTAATHPSVAYYTVSAYVDSNANGVGDGSELMVDITGDGRPDTPTPLATNASLPLLLCYTPTSSGNPNLDAQVTVRSSYDSTVRTVLTHTAAVSGALRLWLHDLPANATADHSRDCTGNSALDLTALTRTTLFNYDSNFDSYPGLGLARSATSCNTKGTLRAQFQFPQARTLAGQSTLTLWTSWTGALTGSTSPKNLRLTIRLLHVSGVTTTTLSDTTLNYSHAQAGWRRHDLALTAFASTAFPVNSYLRLELTCGNGDEDCHVAYDTTTYPAGLVVQ